MNRGRALAHRARPLAAALLLTQVLLLAATVGAEDAAPAAEQEARFEGTWTYAKSPEQGRAIVEQAFAAALQKLDVISRTLARRKLRSADSFVREITIGRPEGRISVRFVSGKTTAFVTRPGAAEKVKAPNGNEIVLTQRFSKGALEQRFVGPRGTTNNRLTLSVDGRALTFSSVIESESLDEPIRFALDYRRVER